MVVGEKMSSFSLPPSFRNFRERASWDDGTPSRAGAGGMKEFVTGMMSPFTACWQPDIGPCAPGCGPDYHARKYSKTHTNPAVVSPLVDRMSPADYDIPTSPVTSYRSTRGAAPNEEEPRPATDIEKPHSNDVLCGRGGSSNRHLGNMHFRELVAANKKTYVGLTKKQKMLVARNIVEMVHSTDPPGRFLSKDLDTGLWYDIGLPRSLEKTSQALREKNSNEYPTEQGMEVSDIISDTSMPYSARSESPPPVEDEKSPCKSRSSKHVEAPPLTVPSHLAQVFGSKKPHESHHAWPDYAPSNRHLEQPYLPSYPPQAPASPRREHYSVPPRPHHYDAPSPRSAHPYHSAPPTHYSHPEQGAPPYPHHSYGHPEPSPPQDYREHYDYYQRRSDPRDHYGHPSPHRAPPPPPPHGAHYHGYAPPPPPPGPPPPSYRQHRHPPPPPHHRPPTRSLPPSEHHRHQHHPGGHGHRYDCTPPPPPHASGHPTTTQPAIPAPLTPSSLQSPMIVKSPSNGYVRSKSEVSPDRRQEWKRQRNEKGVHRKRESDTTALSHAVENALSLEERVVGRERPSTSTTSVPPADTATGSRPKQITSPSGVLQGRSRPRGGASNMSASSVAAASLTEKEGDAISALSGLAALSTAAFLKLDEAD